MITWLKVPENDSFFKMALKQIQVCWMNVCLVFKYHPPGDSK